MTDNGTAPKSPSLKTLEKNIQMIDEIIDSGQEVGIDEPRLVDIRDALDWTHTFLINRRDYHRKRQTMQKVETALLEERLQAAGIDVKQIKKDAERLAEDAIVDSED
jgi:hypothetical protein